MADEQEHCKDEESVFRKEEYLSLRKEIENCLAELSNLERNCVIGVAIAYSWVVTTESLQGSSALAAWLVPATIPVYGAARSLAIGQQLGLLGRYLRTVEEKIFPISVLTNPGCECHHDGWEHFFDKHGQSLTTRTRRLFWVSFLLLSILFSGLGYLSVK